MATFGHSIGGIHVRVYQNMYPSDVVGMVFVDSTHPDAKKHVPSQLMKWVALQALEYKLVKLAMPFGIPRIVGLRGYGRAMGSLGSMPLIVLSHDPDKVASLVSSGLMWLS